MTEPLITPEDIERLKARDERWLDVDVAIRVEEELRSSLVVNLILEAITRRADEALEKLVDIDATDAKAVASCQAEVKCAKFIAESLVRVRTNGLNAAASIDAEGEVELDRDEDPNG